MSARMTIQATKASTGIAAVLVSLACWGVILLALAGPDSFPSLPLESVVFIGVVSAVAGIIRLLFRRGGFGLSVICGVSIALIGLLIVWVYGISHV